MISPSFFRLLSVLRRRRGSPEGRRPRDGRPSRPFVLERLEPRVLLSAEATAPIPDLATSAGQGATAIDLARHFEDPAIDGSVVAVETVLGAFRAELFDETTPETVESFLSFVERGAFDEMIFHRSAPGFVVQGGGFAWPSGAEGPQPIPNDGPIDNELRAHARVAGTGATVTSGSPVIELPEGTDLSAVQPGDRIRLPGRGDGLPSPSGDGRVDFFDVTGVDAAASTVRVGPAPSGPSATGQAFFIVPDVNVRGTLAMAKQGGDPDSATSQWFVNLADNAANLDIQNGGFTTFGRVLFDGMSVVDAIADLPTVNAGGPFSRLPVRDLGENQQAVTRANVVRTPAVEQRSELRFAVVANTRPDAVDASVVDGDLRLTATGDAVGTATIRVRATDLNGGTATAGLDVTVVEQAETPFVPGNPVVGGGGFALPLNRAPDLSELSLFDGDAGGNAEADVTVRGPDGGAVSGSLLWLAEPQELRFVPADGPLAAGDYTVSIPARADGLVDRAGVPLDGDRNGAAGGAFSESFAVDPFDGATLSLPGLRRAPGQAASVPATAEGVPVTVEGAAGVTRLELTVSFDADLFAAGDVVAVAEGWTIAETQRGDGSVSVVAAGPALGAAAAPLLRLRGTVPAEAERGATGLLAITAVTANGGSIAARGVAAVQSVGALGDVDGDGRHTGLDASRVARVAVGIAGGFDVAPRTAPGLLADVDGDGRLTGRDASQIARRAVGLSVPEIPAPASPSASGSAARAALLASAAAWEDEDAEPLGLPVFPPREIADRDGPPAGG